MLEEVTPRKAIEFAVKTEELGQKFYKKLANKFENNPKLKEMFELLAKDEAQHEQQYRAVMDKTPKDEFTASQFERLEYLRIMSLSEFFMGEKGLFKKLEDIQEEGDALLRAMDLEKATLQYYQAMRDVMEENDTINGIIEAEWNHLKKLMEYILTEAKFRGLADPW